MEANSLLEAAVSYAARGWYVVPLHGLKRGTNTCTCSPGKQCAERNRGKHPRLSGWQNKSSTDEDKIVEWWERKGWEVSNVGVQLGPKSKIIDVEFDDDAGRQLADRLLGECFTPTFTSGRSTHRIFQWQDDFDGLPAVVHVQGLEFRLGTGDKGSQSVFPPSRHYSGAEYKWREGLDPDSVDVAKLPDSVLAILWNGVGDCLSNDGEPRRDASHWRDVLKGSSEGMRNNNLASYAGKLLREQIDIDAPEKIQVLFEAVLAVNERNEPPLEVKEVETLFASILKREQHRRVEEGVNEFLRPTVEQKVRQQKPIGSGAKLVIVESEPRQYELHLPAFESAERGCIVLTKQQMCSASQIRQEALEQASYAMPKSFDKVWHGTRDKPGLFEQLVENAEYREAPLERKRRLVIAEILLDKLSDPEIYDESTGEWVDRNHRPIQLPDGSLVFSFRDVWSDMEWLPDKIKSNELTDLIEQLGAKPYRTRKAKRRRYKRIPADGMARLREMIEREMKGGDSDDEACRLVPRVPYTEPTNCFFSKTPGTSGSSDVK